MAKEAKTEAPAEEEVVVSQRVTKADVLKDFDKGLNFYALANKYFGSESDEAVARVREVVEADQAEKQKKLDEQE